MYRPRLVACVVKTIDDRQVGPADLGDRRRRHPLVEMPDDRLRRRPRPQQHLEELLDDEPERRHGVQEPVVAGQADAVMVPEEVLDLAEAAEGAAGIQQDGARPAADEPVSVVDLEPAGPQGHDGLADGSAGLGLLELGRRLVRVVRADEAVPVAPASRPCGGPWTG